MHRPNTRQSTSKNLSRRISGPDSAVLPSRGKTKSVVSSSSLSRGRGRGSTPLGRKPSEDSQSSIKAYRGSSVSRSLASDYSEESASADTTLKPLSTSLPSINIGPNETVTPDTLDKETSRMATQETDREGNPQPSNENIMENLMTYLQEALRTTQDEFRREFSALRESVGLSRNDRETSDTPGISARTPTQANSYSYVSSVSNFKLKDWNVTYNGEGSVSDFLFKVDTLTERSQCPHDHLMSNFHLFLKGKAETFYWDYIKQNQRATYPMLKAALTSEFGTLESDHEILLKISSRKQLPKESYDDFHSFIVRLNLRLSTPLPDTSLIEILKKNVHADLKVMLFISNPRDLGTLRDLARKAEKVLAENKSIPFNRQRQVNEITVEEDSVDPIVESDPQIEALKIGRTWVKGDYSKIKCWNCLQFGHSYIYCPDETRHVFCYKCGQRGVTTPKCKGPHAENRQRSEWATGDARSKN